MPRLGELLVAAGLLTVEQVEQALRAQVMWGGRLGTNLVELGCLDLDRVSTMLGRQHQLPPALARHFEKADPGLQRLLSPDFAERFSCIPVLRMGPEQHVVIASLAPLSPRQLAIIADELSVTVERLVPAIAAELRIRYQLERVYNVRRAARYLRARGDSIPAFPAFEILPVAPDPEPELPALPITTREIREFRLPRGDTAEDTADDMVIEELDAILEPDEEIPGDAVAGTAMDPAGAVRIPAGAAGASPLALEPDLFAGDTEVIPSATRGARIQPPRHTTLDDDLAIASAVVDAEDETSARERRRYVSTLADTPLDPDHQLLGRIAIRKVAIGSAPRIMAGATLGEATRAIRRSTGRDRVADLVIDTLDRFAPTCEAAILLVIRGTTAIGWKGFQRSGNGLGEIAVPLEDGGLIPRAVQHNAILRLPCAELAALDRLLLSSLGCDTGDLVVVPISIASQVMCVIAIATSPGAALTSAEPIAAAAGAAFARLIRDASR